jgi:hypothetical protein
MLDCDLADSYAAFRDDLRSSIQRRQGLERRLESIAPVKQSVKPESFIEFCSRMERAWGITDRGQQRDFLAACVEEIRITHEEVNIRFSLNVAAAMAAIGPEADPDSGTNCQQSLATISFDLFESGHRGAFWNHRSAEGRGLCGASSAAYDANRRAGRQKSSLWSSD